jgi:hypothetical protein
MGRSCSAGRATVRRIVTPKRCHLEIIHTRHTSHLVRKHLFDSGPFVVSEFVAHDSKFRFRNLNHGLVRNLNSISADAKVRTIDEEIFGLSRHIIGNILFLAEDRQKRPKVGSVLDALLGGLGYDDSQSHKRL